MSASRVGTVAWATLRDLGRGAGTALVLLLLLGAPWLLSSGRGVTSDDARRVALGERLDAVAAVAALATLVVAVSSIGDDRRGRRLEAWLASPLTPGEYATGKMLGAASGGLAAAALPLLWLLCAAPDAPRRHPGLFAPRERVAATSVERYRGDGRQRTGSDAVLLQPGDAVQLRFDRWPPRDPQLLTLSFRSLGTVAGDAPALRVSVGPSVAAMSVERRPVPLARRGLERVEFPTPPPGSPCYVLVEAGDFEGAVLLDVAGTVLEGSAGSIGPVVLRAGLGLAALVLLAAAVGVGLAAALPDALSLASGIVLLLVCHQRQLLREVADAAMRLTSSDSWARGIAAVADRGLAAVPDLRNLLGVEGVALARAPWQGLEPAPLLTWSAWLVLCWALARWFVPRAGRMAA